MVDYGIALINANDAHIFLYDGEKITFGAAQWDGKRQDKPMSEPRPDGLTYSVARSGQRVVISDVNQHPLYTGWKWGSREAAMHLRSH